MTDESDAEVEQSFLPESTGRWRNYSMTADQLEGETDRPEYVFLWVLAALLVWIVVGFLLHFVVPGTVGP